MTRDTKIVLSENKSKMYFINSQRRTIQKITVEGCAITIGLRCDYLVICNRNIEHFVELKGSDVKHAIEQIEASIKKLSKSPTQKDKWSFVIYFHCPLTTTTVQKYKKIFKKKYNSSLIVERSGFEYTLN